MEVDLYPPAFSEALMSLINVRVKGTGACPQACASVCHVANLESLGARLDCACMSFSRAAIECDLFCGRAASMAIFMFPLVVGAFVGASVRPW